MGRYYDSYLQKDKYQEQKPFMSITINKRDYLQMCGKNIRHRVLPMCI